MEKTKKRAVALILALNLAVLSLVAALPAEAAYRKGDSGSVVTQIQKKLTAWGYYDGGVDGVYGSRTEQAVRLFQSKNGLTVDGIAGKQTLSAMGITDSAPTAQSNDVALLARLISAEARGEPYTGQVAVGAVVLNRVKHPSFPNSISGVIYQKGAFSCLDDGQFYKPVADSAYRAAREALSGSDPTGGAIYYFNPVTATSTWIWSRPLLVTIGKHRFCA